MKSRTLFVCLQLVIFSALAFADPIACDINLDGALNAIDVQLTINAALGLPVDGRTDVNFDGATNAIDVQLVINTVLGIPTDLDGDGLTDAAEANLGTNPEAFDTDGGGVGDGQEIFVDLTDPLVQIDDVGFISEPTASFTAFPLSGDVPLEVQFTDTSDGDIDSWTWFFGDGTTSTEPNPVYTYEEQGVYTVSLRVTTATFPAGDLATIEDFITTTLPGKDEVFWTSPQDGEWGDGNNWSTGVVPTAAQIAIVEDSSRTISVSSNNTTIYEARIEGDLVVTGSGRRLTVSGDVEMNGDFALQDNSVLWVSGAEGSFTPNGSVDIDNHTVRVTAGAFASFPQVTSYTSTRVGHLTPLSVSGAGSTLDLSNITELAFDTGTASAYQMTVAAADGGHVDLSALTTFTRGNVELLKFSAGGGATMNLGAFQSTSGLMLDVLSGSSLSLPAVSGTLSNGNITVAAGGTATLPGVTGLTGMTVSVGGTMNTAALTSITNSTMTLTSAAVVTFDEVTTITGGSLTVRDTTSLSMAALTDIQNTNLTIQNDASVSAPALTSYTSPGTNAILQVWTNGVFDAPVLADITNLTIYTRDGGMLALPSVTSYTNTKVGHMSPFWAEGAGGVLDLSDMTSITFNTGTASAYVLRIPASAEGHVNLSSLTTFTPGDKELIEFEVGTDGTMDLTALQTTANLIPDVLADASLSLPALSGTLSTGRITVAAGGTLTLPPAVTGMTGMTVNVSGTMTSTGLTTITDSAVTLSGAASVTFDGVTSITGGSVTVQGTTSLSMASVTSLADVPVTIQNDASMSMPALTSYTAPGTNAILQVWTNGVFDAPVLADITNLTVYVRDGGMLALPSVTSYTNTKVGHFTPFWAEGAGGVLDLSSMTSITFNTGTASAYVLRIPASAEGHVDLSSLTTFTPGDKELIEFEVGTDGTMDLTALQTTANLIPDVLAGASLSLPALSGTLNASRITVAAGGTLTLPAVTGITGTTVNVSGTMTSTGLTTITDSAVTLSGTAAVTFNNVTSVTGGSVTVQGTTSLSMTSVTSLADVPVTVQNDASMMMPALTSYTAPGTNAILQVWTNGVFDAPLLADITNLTIYARDGGILALPSVTSYTNTKVGHMSPFWAEGAGGVLDLSNMTSITFNTGTASAYVLRIPASAEGHVDLSSLTTFTPGNVELIEFEVGTGGTMDLAALQTTANLIPDVLAGASLSLPALSGILSAGRITVGVDGTLTMPGVVGMTDMTVTIDGTLAAAGLANLTVSTVTLRGTAAVTFDSMSAVTGGSLTLQDTVSLSMAAVTGIEDMNVTIRGDSSVSAPLLTSYTSPGTNAILQVWTNGVFDAPLLADITNLTIHARSGGTVALPAVTSYTNTKVGHMTPFWAEGANSMLNLSNITSISFNTGTASAYRLTAQATAGGHLDLSAATTFTPGTNELMSVTANGAGSEIDLTAMDPVPAGVTLSETSGGNIINPTLPAKNFGSAMQARSVAGESADPAADVDLNGDGIADAAVIDSTTNELLVWIGLDDEFSVLEQRVQVGDYPVALVITDVDVDGVLDIITANYGSGDLSVLLGLGDGSFSNGVNIAVEMNPLSVSVDDIDGDGVDDIVVVHAGGNVTVLLGRGDGTFQAE